MTEFINNINNLLTKHTLILHIETTSTLVRALNRVDYTLYVIGKDDKRPYKIWSISRTIKAGDSTESTDARLELLKFIIKGGLSQYE